MWLVIGFGCQKKWSIIHSGEGVYYAVTLNCEEIRASVIKQSEITCVMLVGIRK